MKRFSPFIFIAALFLSFACWEIFTYELNHRTHAQSINGVPNQVMSGFTDVAVSTMSVGGSTPLNFAGLLSSNSTTPGSIGANGCADTSFTFTGLNASAQVTVPEPPSTQTTNIVMAGTRVTGANTLSVRFCNGDVLAAHTPVAGVYTVAAFW